MLQSDVPHTSGLLNSTETEQDLLGVPSSAEVWLLALVVAMLAPFGDVFAHGQHARSRDSRGKLSSLRGLQLGYGQGRARESRGEEISPRLAVCVLWPAKVEGFILCRD